jgi:hypothetical protein
MKGYYGTRNRERTSEWINYVPSGVVFPQDDGTRFGKFIADYMGNMTCLYFRSRTYLHLYRGSMYLYLDRGGTPLCNFYIL